ncbi:TnsA-like heteromeric transposase endonuclease subunit [Microbacterium maritypicum]|uniref:TnsA-like heteromeric transposase endonuclease subunit n=1 Tax=Microbacterium maritypicum TaxID=33918 RepID=UPI00142EDF70|nr:TnsA-like heteromeric transposase endonuclease subunit [Microbacterium liquefaciens]
MQLELDAVDCDDVPFERGDAVRSFPSWRLKRHYDGYHWMGALGTSIGFESLTERGCLIELDRTPGVVSVASQPMWIRWTTTDGPRGHYPDYFVRLDDGRAVLMDVKPAAQIKDDVREQFDMTAVFVPVPRLRRGVCCTRNPRKIASEDSHSRRRRHRL